MGNGKWYVLQTDKGQEYAKADLLMRTVPKALCTMCSVPKKIKPFRHGGIYYSTEDILFSGYVFVYTAYAERLHKELQKSREFPQFLIFGRDKEGNDELVPISSPDLAFLQTICGDRLQTAMGITDITVGEDKKIHRASGILEHYVDHVVKLNLHRRVAVARIPLFNRTQEIIFGVRLEQDVYCMVQPGC